MTSSISAQTTEEATLKACCARLYESDWIVLLLGDSFHPGGLQLTERLGDHLKLNAGDRVLDVAAGRGTSALYLARRFGCEVVGIDYSQESVKAANVLAAAEGLDHKVSFRAGDAENLPFLDGSFDVLICECAFCTLPDKSRAAAEFARVLKPRGQVGLSDLTRSGSLDPELSGLLAWIACIGDALPQAEYAAVLSAAGFEVGQPEDHSWALQDLVNQVRSRLLGAELILKIKQTELPGVNLDEAKHVLKHAETAVHAGQFGYSIISGRLK
jgi:ubiquinone/menaquinone biosynthesis C-methylase UbiE